MSEKQKLNENIWTTERIKRFWEALGFRKQTLEDLPSPYRHKGNLGWEYPTDSMGVSDKRKNLPDITDLNVLFKWGSKNFISMFNALLTPFFLNSYAAQMFF